MSPITSALLAREEEATALAAASNDGDASVTTDGILVRLVIPLGDGTCADVDEASAVISGVHSSLHVSMMDIISYWAKAKMKNAEPTAVPVPLQPL